MEFRVTNPHHRRMNTATTLRGPELFAGSRFLWHLTAEQNAGQSSLAEVLVRPGTEPPLHVHAREDETYLVLDGHTRLVAALTAGVVPPFATLTRASSAS